MPIWLIRRFRSRGSLKFLSSLILADRNAKGSQSYSDLTMTDLDGFANWVGIESCRRYCSSGN